MWQVGAADRRERPLPLPDRVRLRDAGGDLPARGGQGRHERHQGVALAGGQVQPLRPGVRLQGVARLAVIGDLQPKFHGAGGQDELPQRRHLPLPPEPSDLPVLRSAETPLDVVETGGTSRGRRFEDAVGDGVDQARAEQRGRVPLAASRRRRAREIIMPDALPTMPRKADCPAGIRDRSMSRFAMTSGGPSRRFLRLARRPCPSPGNPSRSSRQASYSGEVPNRCRTTLVAVRKPGWISAEGRPWPCRLDPRRHASTGRVEVGEREDVDVLAVGTAAADASQVVAGDARRVVEDGTEPVAAVAPGVVRHPFAEEQFSPRAGPGDGPGVPSIRTLGRGGLRGGPRTLPIHLGGRFHFSGGRRAGQGLLRGRGFHLRDERAVRRLLGNLPPVPSQVSEPEGDQDDDRPSDGHAEGPSEGEVRDEHDSGEPEARTPTPIRPPHRGQRGDSPSDGCPTPEGGSGRQRKRSSRRTWSRPPTPSPRESVSWRAPAESTGLPPSDHPGRRVNIPSSLIDAFRG